MATNTDRVQRTLTALRHNEQLWLKSKKKSDKAIYLKNVNEFAKQHKRFTTLLFNEINERNQLKLDL